MVNCPGLVLALGRCMSLRRSLEFDYHAVVDRFANCATEPQRVDALQTALAKYNLRTIAYLADNIPGVTDLEPYIAVTYTDEWINHYRQQDFVRIDPAVREGFTGMLPIDWRRLDKSQRSVVRMFGESREHGLGRHGLTIPIRGRLGERAVLTITTDDSDREWASSLKIYMRDFLILACHLHQSILTAEGVHTHIPVLSPREIECLKWASAGKTFADIAVILSISHRTAKAHLDTARTKLNALNMPHAVTRALQLGIIG